MIYEIPNRINPNSVIISNNPRITRCIRPIRDAYNKTVFPKAQIIPTQKDLDQAHIKQITCIRCKCKHTLFAADAKKLKEEETICNNFKGRQCNQREVDEVAKLNIGRKKKLQNNEKRANVQIPQVFRPKAHLSINSDDNPICQKLLEEDLDDTPDYKIQESLIKLQNVYVTKLCNKEQKKTQEAKDARQTEMEKIAGRFEAFDNPKDLADVIRDLKKINATATLSKSHIITSIKHMEKGKKAWKYKGRFVIDGDKVTNVPNFSKNNKPAGHLSSYLATLTGTRTVYAHAIIMTIKLKV